MVVLRRLLLGILPKTLLSRSTGLVTRIPLPRALRGPAFRAFARRYGADLDECAGAPAEFRSLAEFFQRPLRDGARPLPDAPGLVWPCDGRVVAAGPLRQSTFTDTLGRPDPGPAPLRGIKGAHYSVGELLQDPAADERFAGGSQATVYLAPGDYHRVHAPFAGRLTAIRPIPGDLYPVNHGARRAIPRLFARNARVAFCFELDDGRAAAVVLVAALNVGDVRYEVALGDRLARGQELARFGFGSTTVTLLAAGSPAFPDVPPETVVRTNRAVTAS